MTSNKTLSLVIIVVAQFLCTSLWFSGNAVVQQILKHLAEGTQSASWMTSSVQLGFICGTLFYALFTIPDRFNATTVFLISAILGAVANGLISLQSSFWSVITRRASTGFFLAGIYPVGMKIAADYFEKSLEVSMGFLVGALVLGTASPHLIAAVGANFNWKFVLYVTSFLAFLGGLLMKIFIRSSVSEKPKSLVRSGNLRLVFKDKRFRSAALGYFGHMWELYTFWAFVPLLILSNRHFEGSSGSQTSLLAFMVIGMGAISCFLSGFLAVKNGTQRSVRFFLACSALCCLTIPFFTSASPIFFVAFLIFWGMMVIADSPLLSTLVAQNAAKSLKGTALTIVTCIGFALTILSIQFAGFFINSGGDQYLGLLLLPGPIIGLIALK
ncbi:MAG: MFS transporter [Bacteroidota bacterium]